MERPVEELWNICVMFKLLLLCLKRKKIILSFDYELFFGDKSGTVQKTLIEPTNALLDTMDKAGLKGTFFVDVMMLKYLKQVGAERTDSDYKRKQSL